MSEQRLDRVGIVAIGRNEGERLVGCLESARGQAARVIYVDSGSSDGSPSRARALGAEVVALDPGRPFTAARGRNEGFAALLAGGTRPTYVQFVDGDCALAEGWVEDAVRFLDEHSEIDVVCGRRRERFPEASPYNRLADIEWDTPSGEAAACGGDALMRVSRVEAVGGYDESLIAGEDPELCYRIRKAGGRIWRLDREMTLHDAALTRFSQWWRRMVRGGHAYAEFSWRYRGDPSERRARRLASILAWGIGWPLALITAAVWGGLAGAGLVALAPVALGVRLFVRERRKRSARDAALQAGACVVGKLAEAQGALTFGWRALRGDAPRLIEYKGPEPPRSRCD